MHFTGTHIAYYFICARKLWFFHHQIQCESDSDAVRYGKHVHETSYRHETRKELDIDQTIVIDRIDHTKKVVHETKTSKAMEKSHEWQLKYYLWYLEQKGLQVADESNADLPPENRGYIGQLDYPELKKKETVVLSLSDRDFFKTTLPDRVRRIVASEEVPAAEKWSVCASCAYCELCHA